MRTRLHSLASRRGELKATRGPSGGRDQRASPPRPRERDERALADGFEWRIGATDGPLDMAHYSCACGYQFDARVATTVCCPHCGAGQAW